MSKRKKALVFAESGRLSDAELVELLDRGSDYMDQLKDLLREAKQRVSAGYWTDGDVEFWARVSKAIEGKL